MTDCKHSWRLSVTKQYRYEVVNRSPGEVIYKNFGMPDDVRVTEIEVRIAMLQRVNEFYCTICREFCIDEYNGRVDDEPAWWNSTLESQWAGEQAAAL